MLEIFKSQFNSIPVCVCAWLEIFIFLDGASRVISFSDLAFLQNTSTAIFSSKYFARVPAHQSGCAERLVLLVVKLFDDVKPAFLQLLSLLVNLLFLTNCGETIGSTRGRALEAVPSFPCSLLWHHHFLNLLFHERDLKKGFDESNRETCVTGNLNG